MSDLLWFFVKNNIIWFIFSNLRGYSTVEMGPTQEKIAIDLQTSPLIGNFLLYTMVTL